MSDLMLLGILRMPLDMVEGDPLTLMQFVQCANGAADRIESDAEIIEQLREDLQAAKLLAHANGEMFRAEKAERERLAEELHAPQYTHVETGRLGSLWANGLSREAAEEGFMNYPGALVTVYYGRKWTFANMAEFDSGPPFPLAID
jgi:hypothetical protein